ncbi:InlB B-repeat-containing protein [Listeria welshimeri]|uniref:InlB B-repeat-containing protein n=1 Tax=Listeria welshimeri TaxID=1643 RepID=UPI001887F267|nr:InlB B-repeat-containing protein [Listeria welshimeri]MBF2530430.1 InlB B-repeat-containing protein [Listeria welshimeri]
MKKIITMLLVLTVITINCISSPNTAFAASTNTLESPKPINEIFPDEGLAELVLRTGIANEVTDEVSQAELNTIKKLDDDIAPQPTVSIIQSLKGVEYLHNLEVLEIPKHAVSDISEIEGLIHLQLLNIRDNKVSDLTPLHALVNLEAFYAENNKISDINVLSSLTKLNSLILNGNEITDISALANFPATQFDSLYLDDNQIVDISPLSGKAFYQLTLNDNEISDISPLNTMTLLPGHDGEYYIDISNNHISDISPLKKADFSQLNYFFAENQTVTESAKPFSTNVTLENRVKNIEGTILAPETISHNGSYSGSTITWQLPNFLSSVDYSFSETKQIGEASGVFSGKVTQPLFNGYTVTFDNQGNISTESYTSDVTIFEPTKPTKEGFTFIGWYDAATGGNKWDFTTDKMPANDITLYAQFTEIVKPVDPADQAVPADLTAPEAPEAPEALTDPADQADPTVPKMESDFSSGKEISEKVSKTITIQTSTDKLPKTGDSQSYWVLIGILLIGFTSFIWKGKQI